MVRAMIMRHWDSRRRQGERRINEDWRQGTVSPPYNFTDETLAPNERRISSEDRRKSYGRRHDELDTCNKATCQCGEWNPTTKRYEVIS